MPTSAGTKSKYTYAQLRQLWISAGGAKGWSYVMAAVAMAESGGDPNATHMDANGSVDRGLWQINSIHGYSAESSLNAQNNAKQAVSVFRSSGPDAWSTYKNGAYKKYMAKGKSAPAAQTNLVDPVPGASFERIDQGVDYNAKTPVRALAPGVIQNIYYDMGVGEGVASNARIVEKFNKPVVIGSAKYYGQYYSEEAPLVKKGQKVKAGDPVMKAGSNEIGFLDGSGLNMPPLVGGLGSGTQPSQAGKDYAGVVEALGGPKASGATNIAKSVIDSINVASTDPVTSAADSTADAITSGFSDATGAITGAFSGLGSGIESLLLQGFFILIGIALIIVGLGILAYTLMGKTGTSVPGVVGMVQTQQRIGQGNRRIEESNRASTVRESQAGARIEGQTASRELSRERLQLQQQNAGRRQERYVVKDKPNQVVRKKAGNPTSGVPRKVKG